MSRHPSAPCFRLLLCGAVAVLTISGCRSNERQAREQDRYFRQDPREVPEARRNRLENEPTAFLRSRAHHPIHWQPWSAELFEHALVEQKPVFALVTTGAYRGTRTLLDRLKEDPTMTRTLNTHYLCSLVDLQAHPEFALYCKLLAREINRPVQFPFMIWLSHEGNPIAWLPLSTGDVASFAEVFANSHGMIKRIWKDDPRYVVTNSRSDNDHRVVRIEKGLSRKTTSKLSHLEARHKAGRALSALYDPTSQSIDGAGGLVPFSLLQFASGLAAEPATPDTLRDRLTDLARGH
ncbi:MAG: DUF255 domain-containing protein, partial [Akkermansiaceae bacterium]|nr:DUF255 domain-containing protein [Akkermansiaceae bacterium]